MRRDTFITGSAAAAAIFALPATAYGAQDPRARIEALETRSGGRLGVFAIDTGSAKTLSHRAGERFPMCSTFKLLAVASVLTRVEAGQERLDRRIPYARSALLAYAPVARKHIADGYMTVADLCEAAIVYSDNTAANLLLGTIGGPRGFTQYARSLRDPVTRLDRNEPSLGSAIPGDPRDTTTPAAMANDMRMTLLGNALAVPSRRKLERWMAACRTGLDCLRAGLPATWRAGDKTGSGDNGTRNDIAILWPPNRSPVIVTAYLTGSTLSSASSDATLANVGRIVSGAFA